VLHDAYQWAALLQPRHGLAVAGPHMAEESLEGGANASTRTCLAFHGFRDRVLGAAAPASPGYFVIFCNGKLMLPA
jgi:hypothetical protein